LSQGGLVGTLYSYGSDHAKDFDILTGDTTQPDYASKCDTPELRKVQVWQFGGAEIAPLWTDWKSPQDAITALGGDAAHPGGVGWYDAGLSPLGVCPASATPLAQAMCRVAVHFPVDSDPINDAWVVKTFTDGQENWSKNVTLEANETACRLASDTDPEMWRTRVQNLYTSRGIVADTVLFGPGGATTNLLPQSRGEGQVEESSLDANAVVAALSPDEVFFAALAQATHGTYQQVSTSVAPSVSKIDSDGDGIPDFRDACPQNVSCAADADHDGVLDAVDACPTLAEDGHWPNPNDGCPDTDSDGVRNGPDFCSTLREDGRPPFPADGCPAAHWTASAAPNLGMPINSTVCTNLTVSTRSDASMIQLDISGSHPFRMELQATLMHGRDIVSAFPVGTFPIGEGAFSFASRPIPGFTGDSMGTWTLCITDADIRFADIDIVQSGTLSSWSVHN
jgi:hypothetical protein